MYFRKIPLILLSKLFTKAHDALELSRRFLIVLFYCSILGGGFVCTVPLQSCVKNIKTIYDSGELLPASPLFTVLYFNLLATAKSTTSKVITPHVSTLSWDNFPIPHQCSCTIDLLKDFEKLGQISFTCRSTEKSNLKEVAIDLILVKPSYQSKGLGGAIMKHLISFFQQIAQKTDTNVIFYLISAPIRSTPEWFSSKIPFLVDDHCRRNNFYKKLKLTMAISKESTQKEPDYMNTKTFVPFGSIFQVDTLYDLHSPFSESNFALIDLNEEKIQTPKTSYAELVPFFDDLKFLITPFFYREKIDSPLLYPHINEIFSFDNSNQKSYLKNVCYGITSRLSDDQTVYHPLIKADKTIPESTSWLTKKFITPHGWLRILQSLFKTPFKKENLQKNSNNFT